MGKSAGGRLRRARTQRPWSALEGKRPEEMGGDESARTQALPGIKGRATPRFCPCRRGVSWHPQASPASTPWLQLSFQKSPTPSAAAVTPLLSSSVTDHTLPPARQSHLGP